MMPESKKRIPGAEKLDKFLSEHDLKRKVVAALKELGSDIIADKQMRLYVSASEHKWPLVKRLPQFEKNQFTAGKTNTTYWGNERIVNQARKELDLDGDASE